MALAVSVLIQVSKLRFGQRVYRRGHSGDDLQFELTSISEFETADSADFADRSEQSISVEKSFRQVRRWLGGS